MAPGYCGTQAQGLQYSPFHKHAWIGTAIPDLKIMLYFRNLLGQMGQSERLRSSLRDTLPEAIVYRTSQPRSWKPLYRRGQPTTKTSKHAVGDSSAGAGVGSYSAHCQRKYRHANIFDEDERGSWSENVPTLLLSTEERTKGREGERWESG